MEIDLTKLNPPQREAVTCTEGPLLVLAGAGSGKTRVLTTRIAYLIAEKGVAPWHILALTFTNKAAKEMKERVQKLTGDEAGVWLFTFHGFCARLLSMEIDALGYDRRFTIYDEDDQQALIGHIIKDLNLNDKVFSKRMLAGIFSDAKNHSLRPQEYLVQSYQPRQVTEAFALYQKRLKEANALDFDDLLLKTIELFEKRPDILQKYRDRFRYILVDEYQDTNMRTSATFWSSRRTSPAPMWCASNKTTAPPTKFWRPPTGSSRTTMAAKRSACGRTRPTASPSRSMRAGRSGRKRSISATAF